MKWIIGVLTGLQLAARFPNRKIIYPAIVADLTRAQLVALVSVLAEGATHGPDAARRLAATVA